MVSIFLIATVQIDAPIRRRRLPRIAKHVEARKATVCLTRPLEGEKELESDFDGFNEGKITDAEKANAAQSVPRSTIQYAA
jgi:hypothetical protein